MKVFLTEKNGYNKKEVNDYILNLDSELETTKELVKQKEDKIKELSLSLDAYKQKESLIVKSVESAVLAGEIIKDNNKKIFSEQIERLKNLYDKWNGIFKSIKTKYPFIVPDDFEEQFKQSIFNL